MSRYRLCPSADQEAGLLIHCAHARFVWNLAVEQHQHWRPGGAAAPNYNVQARELTEARAEFAWLRAGSVTVQQQALRDFAQAMRNFFARTHRRPTWRKAGLHEGFRVVGQHGRQWEVRRASRKVGQVWVPKVGWARFRWSRPVPDEVKSYRVTRDAAGRWHVAFAAVPRPIPAPGNGTVVGVDRGVVVSAALSTGDCLRVPSLSDGQERRLRLLQRKLARAKRGSKRRARVRAAIARLRVRQRDKRKNWVEQISTRLARNYDVIGVEDLNIQAMSRSARGTLEQPGSKVRAKSGLNRGILTNAWGELIQRLEHKATPYRVFKIDAAYTSQTCSVCGIRDAKARESQAVFACRSCDHTGNADVNAARNIASAAGRVAAARGGDGVARPVNREPQPLLLSA